VIDTAGDLDAVFPLASVTKIVTALACLVAVEEGILDLDQSAGPPGATVRHCLAHTSGLGYERSDGIVGKPGVRRLYSNAGIEIAADLVAQASEMPFFQYLEEAVLVPLEMRRTSLQGSAAHGIRSTCFDLGRFMVELLTPTLVSSQSVALATTVAFPGLDGILPGFGRQSPCDWGLGFEIRDHKSPHWTGSLNSPETFGHFGISGTFCWIDPVLRLGLVVLTDRAFDSIAKREWPRLADVVIARHRSGSASPDSLPPMRSNAAIS
jgi:CubicO group peptidase (beta-lactamase class C family)